MKRSDGAKAWSRVAVRARAGQGLGVEWERPRWRVSWQDGPTREALMGREAALGGYRVGAPLPFEELRFARSNSAVAVALAWLARGSPESPAAARAAIGEVEAFCVDTGYPQTRFDAGTLPAAELLRRLGDGDIAEMGALLARAVPPVVPAVMPAAGPELIGRVVTYRWPARLRTCSGHPVDAFRPARTPSGRVPACGAASRCTPTVLGVAGRPNTAAARAGRRPTAHGTGRRQTSPADTEWRVVVGVSGRLIRSTA
jgi:hypothetical protein